MLLRLSTLEFAAVAFHLWPGGHKDTSVTLAAASSEHDTQTVTGKRKKSSGLDSHSHLSKLQPADGPDLGITEVVKQTPTCEIPPSSGQMRELQGGQELLAVLAPNLLRWHAKCYPSYWMMCHPLVLPFPSV